MALPQVAEGMALYRHGNTIIAWGYDSRGIVYALTELADRVRYAEGEDVFAGTFPLVERPSARIRSMARLFCSEEEDKVWFYDKQQWRDYLTMLASNRFNRFALTLGMGYNYPYHNPWITDVYFYFPYPFLLQLPGYDIKVKELSDEERDANLEMLKFIGREAARRGLEFQLALWTQRYDFDDVPRANYTVRGVTNDNLAPYCRDAITRLLVEVPEITGMTFRVHVEGGIAEGEYGFWEEAFAGVAAAGRPVEIDMHGKGLDHKMIEIARAVGHADRRLAQISGRAYGPALSPVGDPQQGISARGGAQRARAAERRLAQVPALQLWRPADQEQGLQGHLSHLGGHAARAAVGRSGICRRLWPQLDVCRLGRSGMVRAAELQGTHGHRHSGAALQLPEARHADAARLAQI